MLNRVQKAILLSIVRSDVITDTVKIVVLSYLFYQLCWDFGYYELCNDIEANVVDYQNYDFDNIQNPPSETKKEN